MKQDTKRQNFNITPEQEAVLEWVKEGLRAPTAKDAVLRSVHIVASLLRLMKGGKSIYAKGNDGEVVQVLIPEAEGFVEEEYHFLAPRPGSWRRSFFVKGRRLPAAQVWSDMQANRHSVKQAAEEWDLPQGAIEEIVRYSSAKLDLYRQEAEEERIAARRAGVELAS